MLGSELAFVYFYLIVDRITKYSITQSLHTCTTLLRGGGGGVLVKNVLLIFQPSHLIVFIMISMKKYGEKTKQKFPRLVSMEMAAIFDFRALTKVHIFTSKPLLQMQ